VLCLHTWSVLTLQQHLTFFLCVLCVLQGFLVGSRPAIATTSACARSAMTMCLCMMISPRSQALARKTQLQVRVATAALHSLLLLHLPCCVCTSAAAVTDLQLPYCGSRVRTQQLASWLILQ
jgi:hypothetical protein